MIADLVFLKKFLKTQATDNKRQIKNATLQTEVKNMATEALEYLEKKKKVLSADGQDYKVKADLRGLSFSPNMHLIDWYGGRIS